MEPKSSKLIVRRSEPDWLSPSVESLVGDLGQQPERLEHRVRGHLTAVLCLTVSLDGESVYAGNRGGTIFELRAHDLQPVRILRGHTGPVTGLVALPDGLLSAGGSEIRHWTRDGECRGDFPVHEDLVTGLDLGPEGRSLVSSSQDGTVRIHRWDGMTVRQDVILRGHSGWVNDVRFWRDGDRIVSGGAGGAVLWDPKGSLLTRLPTPSAAGRYFHQSPIQYRLGEVPTVFSVDACGDYVVVGSGVGGTLYGREGEVGLVPVNQTPSCYILSVRMSPDGSRFAWGHGTDLVNVREVSSWRFLKTLKGAKDWPVALAWSGDGARLYTGGLDCTVRSWCMKTWRCLHSYGGEVQSVHALALENNQLAYGGQDNRVTIVDLGALRKTHRWEKHGNWVWSVAFTGDGQIVSGGRDGRVFYMSLKSEGGCRQIAHTGSEFISLSGSPAGGLLAGTTTGEVWVLAADGELIAKWEDSWKSAHSLVLLEDGYLVANWDGEARWVSLGGEVRATYDCEDPFPIVQAAASHEESRVVVAAGSGNVYFFDFDSGERLGAFRAHDGYLQSMALQDDLLVTGGYDDRLAKLWKLSGPQAELVHAFEGHQDSVTQIRIDVEGQRLFTASRDGTVKVWSLEEPYPLLATFFNLRHGRLWTTPPDDLSPSGWIYTDRPDLIEVVQTTSGGGAVPLADDDPRRAAYLLSQNNLELLRAKVNPCGSGEEIRLFKQLLVLHGDLERRAGTRLLPSGDEDGGEE